MNAWEAPAEPRVPEAEELRRSAEAIVANVESVIEGKDAAVRTALTVMLAGGHLLIEDVPGVGKTKLAKALARSVGGTVSRIQFTPDLLPSDVTGVSVFEQSGARFVFQPGAVFANIVIGDEVNRAGPKTQSALLECMEEGQVTVDGRTHRLASPFLVIATQNPLEMEGTYPLPEAQRDRFMARIALGYPDARAELAMLEAHSGADPLDALRPVVDEGMLARLMAAAARSHVSAAVKHYVLAIVRASREDRELRLGASPRAGLQLVSAARARAVLDGREYVLPDDVDDLAATVLAHRVLPTGSALGAHDDVGVAAADIVARIVADTPVPLGPNGR